MKRAPNLVFAFLVTLFVCHLAGAATMNYAPQYATTAEAQAGTNTAHVMTPATANAAIQALTPVGTTSGTAFSTHTLTANGTGKMVGLGATFTPTKTGKTFVTVCGDWNITVTNQMSMELAIGTGTAPANGAACVGTFTAPILVLNPNGMTIKNLYCQTLEANLTVGTAYWADMCVANSGGGTFTFENSNIATWEM